MLAMFISSLPEFATIISLSLALLLDKILGEAKRFHYLVGFGWLASKLEEKLNSATLKENVLLELPL